MSKLLYIVFLAALIQRNESAISSSSNIRKSLPNMKQKENAFEDVHRRIVRYLTRNKYLAGSDNPRISPSWCDSGGLHNSDKISEMNGGKRGGFVSQHPKYLLDDTSSYQQAIKSLQQMLKGIQSGSFNKQNNGKEGARTISFRWKRHGRNFRNGKSYVDYMNSQMPFNEGTKQITKEKVKGEETKWNGSRVRRFLEEERMMKEMKGCNTLEAKEAVMSRVLDPNLNLDGILEPHVRKRRRRSSD